MSTASIEAGPSRPRAAPNDSPSIATTKTKSKIDTLCGTCKTTQAKYTCPRCAARTCSVGCAQAHKAKEGCSGQRDPAKFVPLKEYGQGAWADDYKWLEEGRRRLGHWGEGVKVEELGGRSLDGRGVNGGRGGRGGRGRGGGSAPGRVRGKTDALKRELMRRGCQVQLMPQGMARKKANQSSWNPKTQQLHISIQLSIPPQLLNPPSTSAAPAPKIISHPRVLFSTPDPKAPVPTLDSLLPSSIPPSSVTFILPFCATPTRPVSGVDTGAKMGQKFCYPPLDGAKGISEVLKGTAWVELPTVHVFEKAAWETSEEKGGWVVVPLSQPDETGQSGGQRDNGWGARGKRKAEEPQVAVAGSGDAKKPRVAVADEGLLALGDYESDSEAEAEEGADGNEGEGGGNEVDQDDEEGEEGEEGEEVDFEDAGSEDDLDQGIEDEDEDEDEPPLAVLEAVGAAIAADFGE